MSKPLVQSEIIENISSYLKSIIPNFIRDEFLRQEKKIILCIMIIIHDTLVRFKDIELPAYFYIGHGGDSSKKTKDGKVILNGTEPLRLFFQQDLSFDDKISQAVQIILETDLQIKDWIEDSLFKSGVDRLGLHITIPVKLSENFKLEAS